VAVSSQQRRQESAVGREIVNDQNRRQARYIRLG
jgi:hypothetical protein